MRCDVIAKGIVDAANLLDLKIPVVVRLQGKHLVIKSVTLNNWYNLYNVGLMLDTCL